MKSHFSTLARYNAWANARLYQHAGALPDEAYRRDVGVYFKSLHGTLNHLLVADRIWLYRFTGIGEPPNKLKAIIVDDFDSLHAARTVEDARLAEFVQSLDESDFEKPFDYTMLSGAPYCQPMGEILAHVFNHQTHHRGQAHAALTILGVAEPEPLDLLILQRLPK